ERVRAPELRELEEEILATLDEDLGDREVRWRGGWGAHRSSREGQAEEMGPAPEHPESRDDPAALHGDGQGNALELGAVDPDREGSQVVLRVRAIGVGERLEGDCLVADERRAAGEKEVVEKIAGRRTGGELRHRRARGWVGCEIEH